MSIGTSIIILAAWSTVSACALSSGITGCGFNRMQRNAWILTALAMAWEIFLHFSK